MQLPPRASGGDAAEAGPIRDVDEHVDLTTTQPVLLTCLRQPLRRELPDRLEHPVAVGSHGIGAPTEEALVEEGRQGVELGVADLLRGLQRTAAAEHREAREQLLLGSVEEVVAPLDRRAQRRVPLVCVASPLEQVETLTDPLEELSGREQLCPRGGKLERERQAVEPANEFVHRRSVLDVGTNGVRAFEEERDGVVLHHRREVVLQLAGDPQRFATGDDEPQRRSGRSEVGQRARGVREELLEVVEHDMGLLFAHARRDRRGVVARRAEIPRDRREQESRVPDRRQRDEHGAAVGVLCEQACELEREPRLSRPAGADDGEDSRVVREPGRDRVEQLALSAEETASAGVGSATAPGVRSGGKRSEPS